MNSRTVLEGAVTCFAVSIAFIAVKEDRHQNIMSSVALKKGIEEPWTSERLAKLIDLLGDHGIILKIDTELARIAFRNRVAEMCKAEVATKDAMMGDKRIERAHRERRDADPWTYSNH